MEMDKANKMSKAEAKSQLCGMCHGYATLVHQGAKFESIKTETGVLCLLTAKKGKLVQAIHHQVNMQREMMARKVPCCGTQ
jgi:hypothetical protein